MRLIASDVICDKIYCQVTWTTPVAKLQRFRAAELGVRGSVNVATAIASRRFAVQDVVEPAVIMRRRSYFNDDWAVPRGDRRHIHPTLTYTLVEVVGGEAIVTSLASVKYAVDDRSLYLNLYRAIQRDEDT